MQPPGRHLESARVRADIYERDGDVLVDSHCHLDFLEDGEALDGAVARARRAGVGRLVTICTKLSEFDRVRAIAERHEGVYCSVGVHPHEAGPEGQGGPDRLPVCLGRFGGH